MHSLSVNKTPLTNQLNYLHTYLNNTKQNENIKPVSKRRCNDKLICELLHDGMEDSSDNVPFDEFQANRHLISASPLMYEALKALVSDLNKHYKTSAILSSTYEQIRAAKEALNKAEGKI